MESKQSIESYAEYEFYNVPPTTITAAPSHRRSKAVVPQVMNDEEYLYETPFSYNNRQTSCTRPGIVYYDADPDYFEPEGEYIIDQIRHVQKGIHSNLGATTTCKPRTQKPVQQDVYDEDGYTLARPGAHDDENVSEMPKTNVQTKQEEKSSKKKFGLICIGVLFCCVLVGGIIGASIYALGKCKN